METLDNKLVLAPARPLADLLGLAAIAADSPMLSDELRDALRAAAAELKAHSTVEP